MPPFRADTLATIRLDIGRTAGVVETHTTSSTGTSTTANALTLRGGTSDHTGEWFRNASTTTETDDALVRQVTDFDGTAALTVDAFPNTIAASVDFELWDEDMHPASIDRFINRAINMCVRKAATPLESVTGASRRVARYAVPTNMIGISDIYYRTSVASIALVPGGKKFDGTIDADITVSKDTKDYRWGNASSKFVVATAAAANDTASESITAVDLSAMDTLELWTKDEIPGTPAAADWTILLKAATVTKETLAIPVLVDQTWAFQRISLVEPHDDTAIDEVGLQMTTDVGDSTVWLNDIRAVRDDSGVFKKLHRNYWRIDEGNDEIIFTQEAVDTVGDTVIRIVGVQAPAVLSADATATQVDPEFIIPMVLSWMYLQRSDRRGDRNDAAAQLSQESRKTAETRLARMNSKTSSIRWVR